jgi:hypothetical protein
MDNVFSSSIAEKKDKTETKQKMIENKTKLEFKIVCKKNLNSIKGRLITYGLHTSSGGAPKPRNSIKKTIFWLV